MKDIAIYGAGGLGREVACLINIINQQEKKWNFIGFFDDGKVIGDENEYGKILGGIKELNNWQKSLSIAIAIGSPNIIQVIVSKISNPNIDFPNIIAPDTKWLDQANTSMGRGNIICSNCLISCNVHLGNFNLLNGLITIGHDVHIGDYNALMPAVRVSGEVTINQKNFFGVSSIILQQIKIGSNIVLGANSVLIRKPKDNSTYLGNPATIVKY